LAAFLKEAAECAGERRDLISLVMRLARTALLSMDAKKRAGDKVRSCCRPSAKGSNGKRMLFGACSN